MGLVQLDSVWSGFGAGIALQFQDSMMQGLLYSKMCCWCSFSPPYPALSSPEAAQAGFVHGDPIVKLQAGSRGSVPPAMRCASVSPSTKRR